MSDALPAMLVNGRDRDLISASDRGLLYGDGLFETLAIRAGRACFWNRHMARLLAGCERLGLEPVDPALLAEEAAHLCAGSQRAVLKILLTRGCGGRGYRPPQHAGVTRVLQRFPVPEYPPEHAQTGIQARVCSLRMGHNPRLAGIKHLNRLEQVLARAEWNDDNIAEGLMLDQSGNLVEGTMSNVFLVQDATLVTPELTLCGIAGVVRGRLLELAALAGVHSVVRQVPLAELQRAREVFVCNSLIGIWPVTRLDGRVLAVGSLTARLREWLEADAEE
jgi:4-amino-4-deoxychorismate lyase